MCVEGKEIQRTKVWYKWRPTHQDTSGEVDGGEEENRFQSRECVHLPPLLLDLHDPPHHHVTHLPCIPVNAHSLMLG